MTATADEYCDVVMKGGITSGVVYPPAILALATRYRFKNIGGTSAGAIAAAIVAAAAFGERQRELGGMAGRGIGMAGLRAASAQLGEAGFIRSLFQPVAGGGAVFDLLLVLAGRSGAGVRVGAGARAVLRLAPLVFLGTLAVLLGSGFAAARWPGAAATLLPGLVCALLAAGVAALLRAARVIRGNALGLCAGTSEPGALTPALTDWMHATMQAVAGLGDTRPLLFDDLWDAPRYPGEPATARTLNLEIITTDVSHHEPRTLPFAGGAFWFRAADFARLFPGPVVAWLVASDPAPITIDGLQYHRLPRDGRLPVIVAARMSLSFPILISAVPLYEATARPANGDGAGGAEVAGNVSLAESVDRLAQGAASDDGPGPDALQVCWFSDGGASSNFPLHLFDTPLPRWPTFAIDLVYPGRAATPGRPAVFLWTKNNAGWQAQYKPIAARGALAELGNFLFGLVATMQNWRDLLQAYAPGYRDRIVHVALNADEGGLNLDMPPCVLANVAAKGAEAGRLLADKFDFTNHHWIRYRNTMAGLESFSISLALGATGPVSPRYAASHDRLFDPAGGGRPYPFARAQATEAVVRLNGIIAETRRWAEQPVTLTKGTPRPPPSLRSTPTF